MEECQAMNTRFEHENTLHLDSFNQTSDVLKLPISEYKFDEDTKDFLTQLEANKNEPCNQLVKDFKNKIDLYTQYTSNDGSNIF